MPSRHGLLLTIVTPTVADALGWTGPNIGPFRVQLRAQAGKSNCNDPDTGSSSVLSKVNVTIRRSRRDPADDSGEVFTIIGTSGSVSGGRFSSTVGGSAEKEDALLVVAVACFAVQRHLGRLTPGSRSPVQPPRRTADPSFMIRAYP